MPGKSKRETDEMTKRAGAQAKEQVCNEGASTSETSCLVSSKEDQLHVAPGSDSLSENDSFVSNL